MRHWVMNGVKLAWLIDPYQRKVYVYEQARKCIQAPGYFWKALGRLKDLLLT